MNDLEYTADTYTGPELMERLAIQLGADRKPEIRLFLGIIQDAVESSDLDYFLGEVFVGHCLLIGLDSEYILETILKNKLIEAKRKSVYDRKQPQAREEMIYKREIEGVSVLELAEEYSMSPKTIRSILNPYNNLHAFKGKRNHIRKDYAAGLHVEALQDKYKLSESDIYRALEG